MKVDFNEILEQMAQAFNTTVDKLYPILIKQAYISGVVSLLEFFGSLVLLFVVYKFAIGARKKHQDEMSGDGFRSYWEWTDEGIPWIFGLITAALFVVVAFFLMTTNAPTAFLNPEYWAIKELLSKVGGK